MKRYGNIYHKVCDIENLRLAHKNARRNKTFYTEVQVVDNDLDNHLLKIQDNLINHTYKTSEYTIFTKNDKGKEREIYKLPYYPDRIVHWAIMLQIEKIFEESFNDFTHASIKNRGIHSALKQLDKYLKDEENTKYCLKMDVKKFFPNINHSILKKLLRKKFKDEELLELMDEIIDSVEGEKGVPIGNYLSQYFANFYLTRFDNWLKHTKKVRYVIRYMDDICILHGNKEYLHLLKKEIDLFLKEELDLKLKDNWQIFPTEVRGIDFVGYRNFRKYKLLRKSTYKAMKRKLVKYKEYEKLTYNQTCTVNSYVGWTQWCNSYNLNIKYVKPLMNKRINNKGEKI